MAQVVNVQPVRIEDDGSTQRFIAVLSNQIESRRRQEEAMRQAAIKQREDNMRLFGDGTKNIEKYNQISFIKPAVKNQLVQAELTSLASAINQGNGQVDVPLLMLRTSQKIASLDNYEKNVESVKTKIKELYPSVSDQNIISLANKYFYRQNRNPDGTITEDINWDNLPKIQDLILGEFASNPSRYADLPALTNSMSKVIGGIKTTQFSDELRTDPTGTKLTSIGVKADMMPFEDLIEITDKQTGLKTRIPGVKVVPFAGLNRPDGMPYSVISDAAFTRLINSADKSLPAMLNMKADAMIVDHNTEVIFNQIKNSNAWSGDDDDEMALKSWARGQAVGANAEGSIELEKNFPGFVNKYISSNNDAFVRIAATKAISDLGRYNPDGTVNVVEYNRGIVKDNPRAASSGGGTGSSTSSPSKKTSSVARYVEGFLGGNSSAPLNTMSVAYRNAIIKQAKTDSGFTNISANDIEVVKTDPSTGSPVGYRFVRNILNSDGDVVVSRGTTFGIDNTETVEITTTNEGSGETWAERQKKKNK